MIMSTLFFDSETELTKSLWFRRWKGGLHLQHRHSEIVRIISNSYFSHSTSKVFTLTATWLWGIMEEYNMKKVC